MKQATPESRAPGSKTWKTHRYCITIDTLFQPMEYCTVAVCTYVVLLGIGFNFQGHWK